MRVSTLVAFMLPLSALAAPSLIKRDDHYDDHKCDSYYKDDKNCDKYYKDDHQYDGDVDKYGGWLRESKDYMYKAYEYAWKIDNLHDTITKYGYKEAWDKMDLDHEIQQLHQYHEPKKEVLIVIGKVIGYAHCSAKQLYKYVYDYNHDDKDIMKQYHDLRPYFHDAVYKLEYVYEKFTLISGGKSIPAYFEEYHEELYKCPDY